MIYLYEPRMEHDSKEIYWEFYKTSVSEVLCKVVTGATLETQFEFQFHGTLLLRQSDPVCVRARPLSPMPLRNKAVLHSLAQRRH